MQYTDSACVARFQTAFISLSLSLMRFFPVFLLCLRSVYVVVVDFFSLLLDVVVVAVVAFVYSMCWLLAVYFFTGFARVHVCVLTPATSPHKRNHLTQTFFLQFGSLLSPFRTLEYWLSTECSPYLTHIHQFNMSNSIIFQMVFH